MAITILVPYPIRILGCDWLGLDGLAWAPLGPHGLWGPYLDPDWGPVWPSWGPLSRSHLDLCSGPMVVPFLGPIFDPFLGFMLGPR